MEAGAHEPIRGPGSAQPPRSATAQSTPAAAAVARQRVAQPNGWWGMVLFVCAEVTLFGVLIATYFYLDFGSPSWPPAGIAPPSIPLPLVGAACLVSMSLPLALAARGVRAGRRWAVVALILFAVLIQVGYVGLQARLFVHDFNDFSPQATAYGSIYFTLLAFHHGHVLLGILLELTVVWHLIRHGVTNYWLIGVRAVVLYWHVVNALAVFVVLTQLSPSL